MPTALVIGGATCVWHDACEALELFNPDAFFIINDMIPRWPLRIDYACTLHQEKLEGWIRDRSRTLYPMDMVTWSYKHHRDIIDRTTSDWAGSSGLFATKVALEQGFEAIVLAGIPMARKEGHFVRKEPWLSDNIFWKAWEMHAKQGELGNVRSLSGLTRKLLGAPTIEWLQSKGSAPSDQNLVNIVRAKSCP